MPTMTSRLHPIARLSAVALVAALGGCIQRTITVDSEPQGALVYLNDEEIGRTPVTVPFTFYGVYDVRLEKEGYDTLTTPQKAIAPWWETPGADLVAEASGDRRVDLQWKYALKPTGPVEPASLIDRGNQLRATEKQELGGIRTPPPAVDLSKPGAVAPPAVPPASDK